MALPAILKGHLRVPLIGAPMFIVSNPSLVIEQCKAGIVGSFPALNARPQETLDSWLTEIEDSLAEYAAANPDEPVAPFDYDFRGYVELCEEDFSGGRED